MGSNGSMEKLIQIVKIIAPHILIFIAVGLYIIVGGVVFVYLESPSIVNFENGSDSTNNGTMLTNSSNNQVVKSITSQTCSEDDLEVIFDALYHGCCGAQTQATEECFFVLRDELFNCISAIRRSYQTPAGPSFVPKQSTNEWDFSTALVLSFTIVTTIGYGHIAPKTPTGRLFCVFYGLLGIPLTLLAIADHGRFLASALQFMYVRVKRLLGKLRNKEQNDDDQQRQQGHMENESLSPLFLLILYCGYLFFGSLLLIRWEDEWSFADAFYFGFISLSTIGFGDVVPTNHYYLPWILAYIGIGLILSSTAIDILAEYLKKLHQFGKKIRNVTHAKIWFGGKALTVKELVSTVGKYLGATEETLSHLVQNLDSVVNQAIVQKETGVEPEPLLAPYKDPTPTKVVVETPKSPSPSPSPPVKPDNMDRRKSYHQEADFIDDQELDDENEA